MTRLFVRLATAVVLAAAAVGFTACGGHHHHHHFDGTLEVFNDDASTHQIVQISIDEVGGPDHFDFDTSLDPGESFFVDLFPSEYDVTVFWDDMTFETHTLDIFEDFITTLTVTNDAP